jgi:membrane protease YdiL (CAAX protease family)
LTFCEYPYIILLEDRELCQKEKTASFLFEPLILYFVLFFPGTFAPWAGPGGISFSALGELGRTLTYTIPSLALLWYLVPGKTGPAAFAGEKPGKEDLYSFVIGFPALIVIGLVLSLLISFFSGPSLPPKIEPPASVSGWIIMFFSCIGTGYLEESYFRFYLLKKMTRITFGTAGMITRIALSAVLFSICHIYEGPWGIANAVLAGALLSVLFERYGALHGIAWAHGGYNAFVYFMGIFD